MTIPSLEDRKHNRVFNPYQIYCKKFQLKKVFSCLITSLSPLPYISEASPNILGLFVKWQWYAGSTPVPTPQAESR